MQNSENNKSSSIVELPRLVFDLGKISEMRMLGFFVLVVIFAWLWIALSWNNRGWGDSPQAHQSLAPEVLLTNLNDSQYKVRREAFLQLCDAKLPIDDYLVKESESSDFNRSRVASWLIKLRKSPGDAARKFEMLADYQSMLAGDHSPLFQRI
nr:hypothetical protein [Pirellula sp.]